MRLPSFMRLNYGVVVMLNERVNNYITHRCVGEGATPFPGLFHFTLDKYLILLSVKQEVSSTIFKVFGMSQLEEQ